MADENPVYDDIGQYAFLRREDVETPTIFHVAKCLPKQKGKFGDEYVIIVEANNGNEYQLNLWASQIRPLVKAFSAETINWIGRQIQISSEEKTTKAGKKIKTFVVSENISEAITEKLVV
jgi:hypothetical protein